jgi:hypothetical protein
MARSPPPDVQRFAVRRIVLTQQECAPRAYSPALTLSLAIEHASAWSDRQHWPATVADGRYLRAGAAKRAGAPLDEDR